MISKGKKLSTFKQRFQKKILDPGYASMFFNPYYFVKKGLIAGLRRNTGYIRGAVLDFGCGNRSYEYLFNAEGIIGLDIQKSGHDHSNENIDVYYDGNTLPFQNDSFDSILSIEVFEHVFNIDTILNELYRVLKPGGNILISIPFVWEEHEQPFDFGRYTSFGIRYLLEKQGFKVIKSEKSSGYIQTVCQIWNVYLYKKLLCKWKLLPLIGIPLLIFPTNLIGSLLSFLLPGNDDLYLNAIVVARKEG